MRQSASWKAKLLCLDLMATAAVLLSACGGSSAPVSSPTAHAAPAAGAHETALVTLSRSKRRRDKLTNGVITHRPLNGTGGSEINDDNPGNADSGDDETGAVNPCALISQAAAQRILKAPTTTSQAPLGPTCIYQPLGAKSFVTVTVQPSSFAATKPHVSALKRVSVSGHTAYCGVYGQPSTFVPLPDGRVLVVTAPCAVGRQFAGVALAKV